MILTRNINFQHFRSLGQDECSKCIIKMTGKSKISINCQPHKDMINYIKRPANNSNRLLFTIKKPKKSLSINSLVDLFSIPTLNVAKNRLNHSGTNIYSKCIIKMTGCVVIFNGLSYCHLKGYLEPKIQGNKAPQQQKYGGMTRSQISAYNLGMHFPIINQKLYEMRNNQQNQILLIEVAICSNILSCCQQIRNYSILQNLPHLSSRLAT